MRKFRVTMLWRLCQVIEYVAESLIDAEEQAEMNAEFPDDMSALEFQVIGVKEIPPESESNEIGKIPTRDNLPPG